MHNLACRRGGLPDGAVALPQTVGAPNTYAESHRKSAEQVSPRNSSGIDNIDNIDNTDSDLDEADDDMEICVDDENGTEVEEVKNQDNKEDEHSGMSYTWHLSSILSPQKTGNCSNSC